jgi:transcriptional regulator with XRE-family HTH domain
MTDNDGSSGDFPRRLRAARELRKLSQSDLARLVWGEEITAAGYKAAKNRDRVSAYELGNSRPNPENFRKLCTALETTPMALWPDNLSRRVTSAAQPVLSFTALESSPGKVRLDVHAILPTAAAMKIVAIVQEADENGTSS